MTKDNDMNGLKRLLIGISAAALAGCTSAPTQPDYSDLTPREQALVKALATFTGDYDVSNAAMATAVRSPQGTPVGLVAYESPSDAVRAADMAAYIKSIQTGTVKDGYVSGFSALVLSLDEAAGGDYLAALDTLGPALEDEATQTTGAFLKAWYLALNGQADAAIDAHRAVTNQLPGLSGDLSFAALLDAVGRSEDALAVYSVITPVDIVAPEHEFDPRGLVFSHVQLVVSRKALLLRRLGRIEDAQMQYRRLADAEPEQKARYDDAIASLASGRGIDDTPLSVATAFSRALSDYSLSLAYQRLIASALIGERERGYDDEKGTFDQLALLQDPENDSLRLAIFDDFYDEAMFEAAAHLIASAPVQTSDLQMAAASIHLRENDFDEAETALDTAIDLAEADEKLSTTAAAMGLYALMDKRSKALALASELDQLAETEAERASAHGMSSTIYSQFGEHDDALVQARAAVSIDDTHDRRMVLADRLAQAGEIDEGLIIMRNEALSRPNDPYMLNSLGYYLVIHTERYEEAYRVLARAFLLAPNDPYIADSYGWVRYKLGDLDGAQRYIEQSQAEILPNRNWEIEDHLGDIYWHQGETDKARKAWEIALAEFPPDKERAKIADKLKNGLTEPAPEKQPLPDISLGEDNEVERNDI